MQSSRPQASSMNTLPSCLPPVRGHPVLTCSRRTSLRPCSAVKEVFMPALSSTMTEGKIVSWLKSEGEAVAKGEPLVVVESDKADMDVESFNEGFLGVIVVPDGGVANVGEPIAFIAESEAELEEAKSKYGNGNGAAAAAAAPAPAPVEAAQESGNDAGEAVSAEPAPAAPASSPPAPVTPTAAAPAPAPVKRADGRIIATPYARKLAKELKVDLGTVAGSGPAGRITAADVEAKAGGKAPPLPAPAAVSAVAPAAAEAGAAPVAVAGSEPKGTTVSELRGTTTPFNQAQSFVAKVMVEANELPDFCVSYTIDTDKLDALYKQLKPHGVTMTAILAKACGLALAEHPIIFASCTEDGAGCTYNDHANVAVALATPDGGLITPVLKDADSRDIYTLSRDWADLVKRGRAKKLSVDEINSGTFTLSNLGMFGVDSFTSILPLGTVAILAVAASKPTVVANEDGLIGVKKQMKVNLTCDHRIVYGAEAAAFLKTLKSIIENPDQITM